jgi:hypothetical protein
MKAYMDIAAEPAENCVTMKSVGIRTIFENARRGKWQIRYMHCLLASTILRVMLADLMVAATMRNDAQHLHDYLLDTCDRSRLHVEILLNSDATRRNVIDQIQTHLGRARKEDVVVFHYSGHGAALLSVLVRSRKLTPTLEQMNPGSDFIRTMNTSDDRVCIRKVGSQVQEVRFWQTNASSLSTVLFRF